MSFVYSKETTAEGLNKHIHNKISEINSLCLNESFSNVFQEAQMVKINDSNDNFSYYPEVTSQHVDYSSLKPIFNRVCIPKEKLSFTREVNMYFNKKNELIIIDEISYMYPQHHTERFTAPVLRYENNCRYNILDSISIFNNRIKLAEELSKKIELILPDNNHKITYDELISNLNNFGLLNK